MKYVLTVMQPGFTPPIIIRFSTSWQCNNSGSTHNHNYHASSRAICSNTLACQPNSIRL